MRLPLKQGTHAFTKLCLACPPAADHPTKFEFENGIVGNAIPPNFVPACEKGFREAVNAGQLIGHPVEVCGVGWRWDGLAGPVD